MTGESSIGEKMQQVAEDTRILRIRLLVCGWRMRLRRVPASYYASGDAAYRNASRPPLDKDKCDNHMRQMMQLRVPSAIRNSITSRSAKIT